MRGGCTNNKSSKEIRVFQLVSNFLEEPGGPMKHGDLEVAIGQKTQRVAHKMPGETGHEAAMVTWATHVEALTIVDGLR